MLTQCPECQTVFRATLAQLEAAAGRVRCGQCNTVFDALEAANTADDIPVLEEPIDIQVEPPLDDDDPLADTAEHEILDVEIESTPSIEITMEGERIDINGVQFAVEAEEFAEQARTELAELHKEFQRLAEEKAAEEPPEAEPPPPAERELILPSGARVAFGTTPSAEEIPSMLVQKPRRRRTLAWAAGSMLVTLALITQLVHFNRDTLARNVLIGAPLMRIYAALGLDLAPMWNLQAYELRQWGATADSTGAGALRVRASLFNKAEFAQPYPLLRLTLQDRFGGQVGARDLRPEEYLPGARSGQLLAAGQRIDAEIALVDPGKDAVGFEIDVCLREMLGSNDKTVCANDPQR